MASPNSDSINALLDAGDLEAARAALAGVPRNDAAFIVVHVKLELYDGTLPPQAAMQQLVQLMRKNPDFPGAKDLYMEASKMSYETRQSDMAHSHPPPPSSNPDDEK